MIVNYLNWDWISWSGLIYSIFIMTSVAFYFGNIVCSSYKVKKYHK